MQEISFEADVLGTSIPCHYVKTKEAAVYIISKLMEKDCLFALDTETECYPEFRYMNGPARTSKYQAAGLSPHLAKIRLLQIYDGDNSFIFDLKFIDTTDFFIPFLESKRFVAHNALFDLQFLKKLGAKNVNIGCTFLIAKLLFHACYPTDEGLSASLESLTEKLLGISANKTLQTSDWGYADLTFEQVKYAALDAVYVMLIAQKLIVGLSKMQLTEYYQLIKKVQSPIANMQLNGIGFDVEKHKKLIDIWRVELYEAKKKVLHMTGLKTLTSHTMADWLESNLPEDVRKIWPVTDNENNPKLKTDADTFSDFSFLPIVQPFTEFQKKEKLTSSFGYNLIEQVNPKTKRLHPSFSISGARTGRFSCSKPNLQQLPRDKTVRNNFIPSPGKVLVCADFSQIELRVAAELSRDEAMLKAYEQGIDLHRLTASKILGKPLDSVTSTDRQLAKAFNFGLLFGLGVEKFSHYAKKSYDVEVTREEAKGAIKIFRDTYWGYREWQLEQANNAAISLKCVTPSGKVRCLPAENTFGNSMNHPVQGGASEITTNALIRIDRECEGYASLVNCVHDEIIQECELKYAEDVKELMELCMVEAYKDVFPDGITRDLVEAKIGSSWGACK